MNTPTEQIRQKLAEIKKIAETNKMGLVAVIVSNRYESPLNVEYMETSVGSNLKDTEEGRASVIALATFKSLVNKIGILAFRNVEEAQNLLSLLISSGEDTDNDE